jgi:hypothetical protein
MEESTRAQIRNIKSKVIAMLKERKYNETGEVSIASPSKYWSDFCSYFDYMLGLPEECFSKLRIHTYHLTADNYQIYYFGGQKQFMRASRLELLTENIPSEYILNEPEGGIGFHLDDKRFVSWDIVRYQRVVSTLYRHGVLSELCAKDKNWVLEIGAGYGGLAYHLSRILKNATYIIVDLPETLLFSAAFLSLHNQRFYMYDKNDFQDMMNSGAIYSYPFILLPNYKLDSLKELRFDLVVNVASLQEMRTDQAQVYLDFIRETCKGVFYSCNQDHQPRNSELVSLSDLLRERFDVLEVVDLIDAENRKLGTGKKIKLRVRNILVSLATVTGLLDKPVTPSGDDIPDLPDREYLCKPLKTVGN